MQNKVGETSQTFELMLAYILIRMPAIVILENVKEMMCVDLDSGLMSDCVYVLQKLSAAGYGIATYFIAKAEAFGSGAVRVRIYFVAIRCPKAVCDNICYLIQTKKAMNDAQNREGYVSYNESKMNRNTSKIGNIGYTLYLIMNQR